ncbi:MAG TPA: hypothetical protein VNT55_02300 [Baekduia sp.]|nr:hypothetical protein [Baekduia sp.]
MQIALVAVVLLAGMWFTVLKPKPADDSPAPAAAAAAAPAATPAQPVAPGVKGLATAVEKAKGAAATSDATNAKIQAATGGNATAPGAATVTKKPAVSTATKAKAKKTTTPAKAKATGAAAAKPGTKAATAKATTNAAAAKPATPATPATDVDPSNRLLAYLAKGKTLVILFEGKGADDKAARRAVHRTAKADPKHVVSAYIPITDVGKYEAITSDVQILAAPSILIIGTDRKATLLSGYVDVQSVRQAVGDARRDAAAAQQK